MAKPLRNHNGSVLPLVLIFSSVAFITVVAFVSGQYLVGRPALMAPATLQAHLTARSGIWKALDNLNRPPDTLKGTNTLDSTFANGLLGNQKDTSAVRPDKLVPDDSVPLALQPFSCDSFGSCEVSLTYAGCFEELRSKGTFLNKDKFVRVRIGGKFSISSDTVLFLDSGLALQSPIRGKLHIGPRDSTAKIRADDLNKLLAHFSNDISDSGIDTMMPALPLLVQHNIDFEKIPSVVKGPLFIDGSLFDLAWKSENKIIVLGDLQITGKVIIEGPAFVVTGEAKILDDAHFRDVTLFSSKRISIENRAVFSGTAITLANLVVSGNAIVENRSIMVIAHGISPKTTSNAAVSQSPAGKNPPAPTPAPAAMPVRTSPVPVSPMPVSLTPGARPALSVFSATFTGSAVIDASVICYNNQLGIKIDNGAIVKGILWTDGAMGLDGKVYGIVYANKLVDGDQAVSGKSLASISVIRGAILPFLDPGQYYVPFFLGKLSIISWLE
jgi:cytoskeletal protein CcmA (bactofilin family)